MPHLNSSIQDYTFPFFPQLIAGPIVKYRDINKQIENRKITYEGVSLGFKRFIYGLSKKVLIANVLGLCVDTIYSYDVGLINWRHCMDWFFGIHFRFTMIFPDTLIWL